MDADGWFGRLAVERGLASPELVQTCARQAQETGGSLPRLLAERAGIPLDQARALHQEASRRAAGGGSPPTFGVNESSWVRPAGAAPAASADTAPTSATGFGLTPATGYGAAPGPPPGFRPPPPAGFGAGVAGSGFGAGVHGSGFGAGPAGLSGSGSSSGVGATVIQPGARFGGRYVLERELGRGGMGMVWKARQLDLDRPVALKMMSQGPLADERLRQRFLAEARSVARLIHANIVAIHDVGQEGGVLFFSMDYVDGPSLADRLKEGPLELSDALNIIRQLADALDYAHQQGIVHRDMKPANVLLTPQGVPRLTDFGIAKDLRADSATRDGEMLGTPAYMSPEQASGHAKDVDGRSDIYSLGAILYRLVTDRPPFEGNTPYEVIHQVLTRTPTPPRRVRADLPRPVEELILRCLAKNREDRYGSARELVEALEQLRFALAAPAAAGRSWAPWIAAALLVAGGAGAAAMALGSRPAEGGSATPSPTAAASPSPSAAADAGALASEALRRFEAGAGVPDALRTAREAVALDPKNARAHWVLGHLLLLGEQQPASALIELDAALATDPALLQARIDRGACLLALERAPQEIEEEAQRLEALGTEGRQHGAVLLADLAERRGDLSVAALHLDEAVRLAPKEVPLLLRLARLHLARRGYASAERLCGQILAIEPRQPDALGVRARARQELGQAEGARGDAEQALALDPGQAEAKQALERLGPRVEQPRPTPAPRPTGPVSPAGESGHDGLHATLKEVFEALKRRDVRAAQAAYQAALRVDASVCEGALMERAEAGLGLRQPALAERDLRRYVEVFGEDWRVSIMLAEALLMQRKQDEALQALEQAARLQPNEPQVYQTRWKIYSQMNRLGDAEADLRKLWELTPGSSLGPHELAHVLLRMERAQEALGLIDQALAIDADSGHMLVAKGDILQALGRSDEARQVYQQALQAAQQPAGQEVQRVQAFLAGGGTGTGQ